MILIIWIISFYILLYMYIARKCSYLTCGLSFILLLLVLRILIMSNYLDYFVLHIIVHVHS